MAHIRETPGDTRHSAPPAALWVPYFLVALITALRIWALANDRTDLFVDEAQYWLWGQRLDFGYFSKPPLIAWLLRAVTDLAGQDTSFWIRISAPVLHGITALLVMRIARPIYGQTVATLSALAYLTMSIVAVGSYMISTDTLAAPFYATALSVFMASRPAITAPRALAIGGFVGLAVMAKYAGLYFYLGLAAAALVEPTARPGWRNAGLMLLATLCVAAPNLLWNVTNDLTTLRHLGDSAGWVDEPVLWSGIDFAELGVFLGSQIAAMGPILAAGFVWLLFRPKRPDERILVAFSLPILALVSVQALLFGANANWAFLALLPAVPLTAGWLWRTGRRLVLIAALVLNGAISVSVAAFYVTPEAFTFRDRPIAFRFLGRAEFSRQILRFAQVHGAVAIASADRDILADLFHTGRGDDIPVFSIVSPGPPRHYFDQTFPFPTDLTGPVVWIGGTPPTACSIIAEERPDLSGGAYARRGYLLVLVEASCLTP